MTTPPEISGIAETSKTSVANGFDAPVASRADDHLNRWPLARQVYSVAVDGPADWSARIGVYGEWGTGKSSVLKFVEALATADRHLVVWFNPWAFSSKSGLWRAFVMEISSKIEPKEGEAASSGMREWKARLGKLRDWLSGAAKEATGDIAGGASVALDAVRGLFAFTPSDVAAMRSQLGDKRVIILIDDLDRTSAELVPEILYALKEIMDVPGFSFICGFDPKVVGEVLKQKHLGFGDGLKFLEKIIDYPVWLPPPSDDGLKQIAEADAAKYCPFVPSLALHDALDLLPKNPRSIRQFVRLCALLKTQTERHGNNELNWPIILTANAIKVRYPMLDFSLLHSPEFYGGIGMRRSYLPSSDEGAKVDQEISAHAEKCLKACGIADPSGQHKEWLQRTIRRICRHLDLWMGEGVEGVIYQSTLIERPKAVTGKEFDSLLQEWAGNESIPTIGSWIERHAETQGSLMTEVASGLITLLLDRLKDSLKIADGAFTKSERTDNRAKALKLLELLEELVLRPAGFHADLATRNWVPLEPLFGELVPFAETKNVVHRLAWKTMSRMLKRLVSGWDANFEILLGSVRSIGRHGRRRMDGNASFTFAHELNTLVDDQLSNHIIDGVQEVGFIGRIAWQRPRTREMRRLIHNPQSRLWTRHRARFVAAFSKRPKTQAAQANAYEFLEWIRHLLENHQPNDDVAGKALLGDKKLMPALWRTATCRPFLGKHAHYLRDIPSKAAEQGIDLKIPKWWQPAIDEYLKSLEAASPRKVTSSENAQESDNLEA